MHPLESAPIHPDHGSATGHPPAPWSDPEPGLIAPDGRHYPLESATIEARAEGGMAVTLLRQRFHNPFDESLEVLYSLPLPADGAVLGYEIRIGDRRIVGEILPRADAEAAYREALYEGRTAGLLEQERADTFTERLGNIPAQSPVEVEIQILHPLAFRGAAGTDESGAQREAGWEYRFPTTLGVRYMGAEGRVDDAERLEPGRSREALPARLTLDLQIADAPDVDPATTPGPIHSRSHALRTERDPDRTLRVQLAKPSRLNRDLVLRWPALGREAGVRGIEGAGLDGDPGRYALLTVLPPERPSTVFPRDVTLLLDASGSMTGLPLELATRVVDGVLAGLSEQDHFELLVFSDRVRSLTSGLIAATESQVAVTRTVLRRIAASGCTEMATAFLKALAPRRSHAQRQVVLISDGYIGFEDEVIGLLAGDAEGDEPASEGRVRVHTVGVGSAPNRTLTAGLARAGGGRELFATDAAEADEAVAQLRAATDRPVLCGLTVSGSAVRRVAPRGSRDVSAGHPALLSVELRPEGGTLEVAAREPGSDDPWSWQTRVPGLDDALDLGPEGEHPELRRTPLPLGALHGRERVADLELRAAGGRRTDEPIADEIEAVALRHRIVSRRTSLVAVDEEVSEDPRTPRRRVRLPAELPAGVSALGMGLPVQGSEVLADLIMVGESDAPVLAQMSRQAFFESLGAPIAVEVVHRDAERLVVEFEVPFDDFRLPTDPVTLRLPDGSTLRARVDREQSTAPDPHPAGVRVRLALGRLEGEPWPSSDSGLEILPDGWR